MNKAKFYPWIFTVVFGVVGIIMSVKVGCIYQDLISNTWWRLDIYTEYIFLGMFKREICEVDMCSHEANILRYLGILSFTIMFIAISIFLFYEGEYGSGILIGFFGCFLGFLLVETWLPRILCDYYHHTFSYGMYGGASPATGVLFGSFIWTVSGLVIGIIVGFMKEDFLKGLTISIIIFGILGSIVGGSFYNNGFIVGLSIVPAFASIGYAIGVPIKERAEQRAEIKRKEKLERERIRREEERRRKEYEQKMKEFKLKLKQWKEEGYDVSELEEMLK